MKVVVITGGNRGMGAAMVRHFKNQGAYTVACASSASSRWESQPDLKLVCDVQDKAQVEKFISQAAKAHGQIDVLINNAGLSGTNPLEPGSSDELWDRILGINLQGTYLVTKSALPSLRDGGRIINISSVLGLKGVPDATAYCAAKHGVIGFTRALAHSLAPRQITVNAICPGWTRTDMALGRMQEIGLTEQDLGKTVPLGRMIEPQEIAELAAYLASEAASGITGQSVTIDGGVLG